MRLQNSNGGSAVEFAIVLPILLLLVLGIIESSFLLYNKAVMTNACREGARRGIVQRSPEIGRVQHSEIETEVNNYCFNHLITFGGATTPTVISTAPCPTGAYSGTDLKVTVTFRYNYLALPNFIAGLIGGTELKAEAVMKCE
jgi:Flp pilus assembly protein TadG